MNSKPRLLLLQIRNEADPMKEHEYSCFLDITKLSKDQLVSIDAVRQEFLDLSLDRFDGLLVGGSGEYSMANPEAEFLSPMCDFLSELVDRDFPIFASCFGFHALAHALGSKIITDMETMEVGGSLLTLTDQGCKDELFSNLPKTFFAQFGHKDRLATLPDNVVNLARGEVIECQAFRVIGRQTWATQFHPELTNKENQHRYLSYLKLYPGQGPDPTIMASFVPTPEANTLIERFIDSL